ncbi:hypothetical protein E4U25_006435 [Claviceps purpurea]|nr:hypothetical protein E4U25_006435 [Claviceps purpurea]
MNTHVGLSMSRSRTIDRRTRGAGLGLCAGCCCCRCATMLSLMPAIDTDVKSKRCMQDYDMHDATTPSSAVSEGRSYSGQSFPEKEVFRQSYRVRLPTGDVPGHSSTHPVRLSASRSTDQVGRT